MLYGLAADRISGGSQPYGEVQEWLNWQHWKCCVRGTVPWVRIPPSPPENLVAKRRGRWEVFSSASALFKEPRSPMRQARLFFAVLLGLLACALPARDAAAQRGRRAPRRAAVCPDPTVRCKTSVEFQPYQLPFVVPANGVISE